MNICKQKSTTTREKIEMKSKIKKRFLEICNSIRSIRFICKSIKLEENKEIDELKGITGSRTKIKCRFDELTE